jgi:hypothetical protein
LPLPSGGGEFIKKVSDMVQAILISGANFVISFVVAFFLKF